MWTYVEQNFGVWTVPGGMGSLADALASRLRDARRDRPALHRGRSTSSSPAAGSPGCAPRSGVIDADHVVVAIDPRRLPALAPMVERTMPAIPPVVCHLGLVGDGARPARARWSCTATRCWCCAPAARRLRARTRGRSSAGAGSRRTSSPPCNGPGSGSATRSRSGSTGRRAPWCEEWGGSPYGVLWQGRNTVTRRLGPHHTGARRLRGRRARDPRRGPAVGRPLRRAGGAVDRTRLSAARSLRR